MENNYVRDREFARLMAEDTPPLNPLLANGLAVAHVREAAKLVDEMWRAAQRGFPEQLTYHGCARVGVEREFEEISKKKVTKKKSRRMMDTARSDVFLMRYMFRWNGEQLPDRFIYLPFVGDAGSITLSGSQFFCSPLLSDPVISITSKNVFTRLLRDKVTFERMSQSYYAEKPGIRIRESTHPVWSAIYHTKSKSKSASDSRITGKCTLVHYLLCKYGFAETFARFGNCHPEVGWGDEITSKTHPLDQWVICTSSALTEPKGRKFGAYVTSELKVAVRVEEYTPMVKNMLGGLFYIVDLFPNEVLPKYIDNTVLWRKEMGYILFDERTNLGTLIDRIDNHIASLDQYLDEMIQIKLRETGIDVKDIYELFAVIIEEFDNWLVESNDRISSMYDKELSILPFLLEEIKQDIFQFYFRIKAAMKKPDAHLMKKDKIINMMNATIKPGRIHRIRSGHGEVQTISYSGDNKVFKITSNLVPQEASSGVKNKNDRAVMTDPAKRLHSSIAEIGGYSALTKAAPDGRGKLNTHARLDDNNMVMRNPSLRPMLEDAQRKIEQRIVDF